MLEIRIHGGYRTLTFPGLRLKVRASEQDVSEFVIFVKGTLVRKCVIDLTQS